MADEPTGNLDSRTAATVMLLFEELVAAGKTILMVTHDRTLARRTSRTLVISDGELVDGAISAALPDLPDAALLALSKGALRITLAPGASLPTPDRGQPERVYVVSEGVMVPSAASGSLLGIGSLLDPRAIGRTARAGESGVELLALPRERIAEHVEQAPGSGRSTARAGGAWVRGWVRRKRGTP